jgi:hypothetical protein
MEQAEVLIAALLAAVVGLSVLASRLSVPYPILLVVGGALFGFCSRRRCSPNRHSSGTSTTFGTICDPW